MESMAYKDRLLVSGKAGGATNCMSVAVGSWSASWVELMGSWTCSSVSDGQNQKAAATEAAKTRSKPWVLLKGKEFLPFDSAIVQI
jgi:hypothetical protein